MRHLEMNKSDLDNLYGLSCIENFLLYVLKKESYSYRYLFFESMLSFRNVVDAFVNENLTYAYFNKVERLQNIASAYDLIVMLSKPIIEKTLFEHHDYICMMVKPTYIQSKYKVELWRDDHYILLLKVEDDKFFYLNDTPRDAGILSWDEVKSIFAGSIIVFDIKKDISDDLKTEYYRLFIDHAKGAEANTVLPHINDFVMARDILGVYRILSRRIYEFCSLYINMEVFTPVLNELDRYYASLEYMRLRNRINFDSINQMFADIYRVDMIRTNKIIDKMEKLK